MGYPKNLKVEAINCPSRNIIITELINAKFFENSDNSGGSIVRDIFVWRITSDYFCLDCFKEDRQFVC